MPRGAITVIPGGGLGNRLAVVDSALALGRALERPVHLVWRLGRALNCRFDRLFEPLPGVERVTHTFNDRFTGRLALRLGQVLADLRGATTWHKRDVYAIWHDPARVLEEARRARELRIRADVRFFADDPLLQGLRPVADLAERIARRSAGLERAVAVHVRRTDNAEALRRSPISAFAAAMRQALERTPDTTFFVCTDDPRVVAELRTEFGERIRHDPPASFARHDPEAIRDAVVDLWCMAACRAVLASPFSSFSEAAWQLRGIPYRVIDLVGRPDREDPSLPSWVSAARGVV